MRKHYNGFLFSGDLIPITDALIKVYLASSLKLAKIYSEKYNLKSVWGARIRTDNTGYYRFFIDTDDYEDKEQTFKIESHKKGFVNCIQDEIEIITPTPIK